MEFFELIKINTTREKSYHITIKAEAGREWSDWIPKSVCTISANKKVIEIQEGFAAAGIWGSDK